MINGGGYPRFRYPRDTHFASQLVHVCDVFDALCTTRPYREAWDTEVALAYMEERAGVDFNAEMVEAFTAMMRLWSNQRIVMPSGPGSPPPVLSAPATSPAPTPPPLPPRPSGGTPAPVDAPPPPPSPPGPPPGDAPTERRPAIP